MTGLRTEGGAIAEGARRCPQCQKPMDSGTLGFFTYLGGARWFPRRNSWMTGGDPIVKNPLGGDTWIDGLRCPKCRLLLLSY